MIRGATKNAISAALAAQNNLSTTDQSYNYYEGVNSNHNALIQSRPRMVGMKNSNKTSLRQSLQNERSDYSSNRHEKGKAQINKSMGYLKQASNLK